MMRTLPSLLLSLSLLVMIVNPTRAQTTGSSVTRAEFFSETLDRAYRYNVYLPAGYGESSARYPVIYLLHGRGDTMDGWLNIRSTLDEMIASEALPPIIAVMPDMPSSERASYYVDSQYTGSNYPAEPVETAFMNDLIPYVDSTYQTLTNREARLVGGYSMGGYGAIRYALAYPEAFVGALVLSPAVYIPLPPTDSSTREFGAFGSGDTLFSEAIYQSLNYPALLEPFAETGLGLQMFIAVGDDEYKNPNPEDQLHDLDVEAHLLFNQVTRVPNITSEFRVYDGGHDWDVWERGFVEGMTYLANFLDTGGGMAASGLDGSLLGSAGDDFAGGIALADDGSIVQALAASGSINGEEHLGEMDIALVKYDADGEMLWTRQFGTPATERAYGIALDSQGAVVVAGYTNGDFDGQHADNAANDAFVAKFTADGEPEWRLQFGDPAEADRVYGLAVADDDRIYVGGYTRGSLNGANAGDKDIFIAQISSDGTLAWLDQFGGEGEDKGYSLATDGSSIYLAGVTGSPLGHQAFGGLDGFITAYTSSGELVWLDQFGSDGWDEATGVTAADGAVYVTGFAAGSFDEHPLIGDKDIIVAAYDGEGYRLWSDQVGTNLNDKGADVDMTADDILIVAGFTDGNLAGSAGNFDVVLLEYQRDGALSGIQQLGTSESDGADEFAEENLFIAAAADTVFATGLTEGGVGDTPPFGSYDVFVTEFDLSSSD